MKRSLFMAVLLVGLMSSVAIANVVTVTSNPIWTDTGIGLTGGPISIEYLSGSWTWQVPQGPFGPDGDTSGGAANLYDEWITNGHHMQLIGFVGADPFSAVQDDSRLFVVAFGTTISGMTGELWLGANDDFATEAYSDNAGSLQVRVPEPFTILLLGLGLVGLAGVRRFRK